MTNKFEQLIEMVINDEEQKARELFHDIVVEKSREIYESLMEEEVEESEELEEAECDTEEMDESIGGDSSDDLMSDVETDESGMSEEDDSTAEFDDEAEEAGEEETKDIEAFGDEGEEEAEGEIEDRVVDLEDKLDELMAEFEALMGGEEVAADDEGIHGDMGGDTLAQDDTAEFADETGDMMAENIDLVKVPAPKHGDDGANNKSVVAFNSGAAGMASKPVTTTGAEAKGRPAPKAGELIGKVQNTPGGDGSKLTAATKPTTAQASGTNTRSPLPKG